MSDITDTCWDRAMAACGCDRGHIRIGVAAWYDEARWLLHPSGVRVVCDSAVETLAITLVGVAWHANRCRIDALGNVLLTTDGTVLASISTKLWKAAMSLLAHALRSLGPRTQVSRSPNLTFNMPTCSGATS